VKVSCRTLSAEPVAKKRKASTLASPKSTKHAFDKEGEKKGGRARTGSGHHAHVVTPGASKKRKKCANAVVSTLPIKEKRKKNRKHIPDTPSARKKRTPKSSTFVCPEKEVLSEAGIEGKRKKGKRPPRLPHSRCLTGGEKAGTGACACAVMQHRMEKEKKKKKSLLRCDIEKEGKERDRIGPASCRGSLLRCRKKKKARVPPQRFSQRSQRKGEKRRVAGLVAVRLFTSAKTAKRRKREREGIHPTNSSIAADPGKGKEGKRAGTIGERFVSAGEKKEKKAAGSTGPSLLYRRPDCLRKKEKKRGARKSFCSSAVGH